MLPQLPVAQRRALIAKYQLDTSSPTALLVAISQRIAQQSIIDPALARLLAFVAAIDSEMGDD